VPPPEMAVETASTGLGGWSSLPGMLLLGGRGWIVDPLPCLTDIIPNAET